MSTRADTRHSSDDLHRIGVRPLSRTLYVLIPLHVVAFAALYLGVVHVVDREVRSAHTFGAWVTLNEMVNDLHPAMEGGDAAEVRRQLRTFTTSRRLLDLRLFDSEGRPIGEGEAPTPQIASFLESGAKEQFEIVGEGRSRVLEGTMAIVPGPTCTSCHETGATLGAAVIRLDLTSVMTSVRNRVRFDLLLLIAVWVALVGALDVVLVRAGRHAVRRLHTDPAEPGSDRDTPSGIRAAVVMDPVALELYSTLSSTLARQLREKAETVDRMHRSDRLASLGQLAAGLAHEIKNPLAGIHSVVELLNDGAPDDRTREIYDQILAELGRVNGTLQTLLTFARPNPPQRIACDIGTLLEDAATLLRPSLVRRSIELDLDLAADLKPVSVDPSQLRQIVVNLVTNAADAIGTSGRIRVAAAPDPGGSGLILEVADDGPGIPEDHMRKIFEPFFTTKFSGTGLGLAIVRSLVAKHGGYVEVESSAGEGTRFFVTIPAPPDGM